MDNASPSLLLSLLALPIPISTESAAPAQMDFSRSVRTLAAPAQQELTGMDRLAPLLLLEPALMATSSTPTSDNASLQLLPVVTSPISTAPRASASPATTLSTGCASSAPQELPSTAASAHRTQSSSQPLPVDPIKSASMELASATTGSILLAVNALLALLTLPGTENTASADATLLPGAWASPSVSGTQLLRHADANQDTH